MTVVTGGANDDTLIGTSDNDQIYGGGGNDILLGLEGADFLDGGDGYDRVSYAHASAGVVIDLFPPGLAQGGAAGDSLVSIEAIIGSSFNDQLTGDDSSNSFAGNAGDDVISGRGGNDAMSGEFGNDTLVGDDGYDWINAGPGNDILKGGFRYDTLIGGADADSFVFDTALKIGKIDSTDTIEDFSVLEDTIVLDDAIFTKLKPGPLNAKAFHDGRKAHDGNDRIIYNDKNGTLIYDKNGDDKGGAAKVAVLSAGLDLSEAVFLVI